MLATNRGSLAAVAIILIALAGIAIGAPRLLSTEEITGAQVFEAEQVAQTTITLNPTADAWVDQASPTSNLGTTLNLKIQSCSAANTRAYVKFDLSSIPLGSTISSAVLQMPFNSWVGTGSFDYSVNEVPGTWSETGITWTNQPGVSNFVDVVTIDNGLKFDDMGSSAQAIVNGGANNGWVIKTNPEGSNNCNFLGIIVTSRESSNKPTLTVTYTPPPSDATKPTISATHSPASPTAGQPVTFTVTATDNVAVSTVRLFVDNAQVGLPCTGLGTASVSCTYTNTFSQGPHTYFADAVDSSGNAQGDPPSGTKSFTVQAASTNEFTTPFILNAFGPTGFRACTDTDGGVAAARAFCQCKGFPDIDVCLYENTGDNDRFAWTPGSAPACINQGASKSTGVGITKIRCSTTADTTPPTVNPLAFAPPVVQGQAKEFTSIATDNKGIAGCNFYWNNAKVGAMNFVGEDRWRATFAPPSAGTFIAYANCTDFAGNSAHTPTQIDVSPEPVAELMLAVTPDIHSAGPGDAVTYNAKVTNNGAGKVLNVTSLCIPPGGFTCNGWTRSFASTGKTYDDAVALNTGDSANLQLRVTSPTTSSNIFQNFTIRITATAISGTIVTASEDVLYEVIKCDRLAPGLDAEDDAISAPAGANHTYTIAVENRDDCVGTFNYTAKCPSGWTCTLSAKNGTLAAGADEDVTIKVKSSTTAKLEEFLINFTATNTKDTSQKETLELTTTIIQCTDTDGDGFSAQGGACGAKDCNDNQTTIFPTAKEICGDSVDNNCDGFIDSAKEGCTATVLKQTFGSYDTDDGVCDYSLGETSSNSPIDCKPSSSDAFCGNDDAESGEQCDGTDDATCPNLCDADCSCPFLVGDNFCNSAAGETASISDDCMTATAGFGLTAVLIVILLAAGGGAGYYFLRRRGLAGLSLAHGVNEVKPGRDLEPAVDAMISQGYNPDEISSQLTNTGWSQTDIRSAMSAAHEDQTQLGALAEQFEVDTPSYEIKKAEKYVKACMTKGFTPTEIRAALKESGWPESRVDEIINKFTEKHVTKHASEAGKPSENLGKLKKYVKKELEEGHTPQQIKKALKDSGWSSSAINDVLP